ncbi:MAG: helix-turn-helix transcriptional regulator [Armatimonadota bacterium]
MKTNIHSVNKLGSPPAPVQLMSMWHVDADAVYSARPQRQSEHHMILIRTHSGEGLLELSDERSFDLTAGSLILVQVPSIRYYHTTGSRWAFDWFEMQPMHHSGLELDTIYMLPVDEFEILSISQIIQQLDIPDRAAQTAANALFAALFCRWLWQMPSRGDYTQNMRQMVWQAVDIMKQQICEAPSIHEVAHQIHVSERWLRQAFVRVLGIGPKSYQDQLRLSLAASALRMESGSIVQLAERYGYGSPFHFSRAFKKHYGMSPSQYRQNGG